MTKKAIDVLAEQLMGEPIPDWVENEEQLLQWKLESIHRAATKLAEPIVKRLAEIEALKPPKPMFIPVSGFRPDGLAWLPIAAEVAEPEREP